MVIVGARPNFMKGAAILDALKGNEKFEAYLVHTGQHYDKEMSDYFFEDLKMARPDKFLGIGSSSHTLQTANIMIALEQEMIQVKPDLVMVVGDVNSTVAAALVAAKMNIPLAHIEAGLRSFDNTMPEEINRKVTDALSDYLFVTERGAIENLRNEGKDKEKIFFVGNVMIDTLMKNISEEKRETVSPPYFLLTLHRPSNVDTKEALGRAVELIKHLSSRAALIFPCHPRTANNLKKFGLNREIESIKNIKLLPPQGYIDFVKLMRGATAVLSDSGGIQEETTALGIPCLTLRENTERPITIEQGTNQLVGMDQEKIMKEVDNILSTGGKKGECPELWDGKASHRIVKVLEGIF